MFNNLDLILTYLYHETPKNLKSEKMHCYRTTYIVLEIKVSGTVLLSTQLKCSDKNFDHNMQVNNKGLVIL